MFKNINYFKLKMNYKVVFQNNTLSYLSLFNTFLIKNDYF